MNWSLKTLLAQCKRDVKVSNNLKVPPEIKIHSLFFFFIIIFIHLFLIQQRKDLEEMQEEQPLKKTLHELPVRSRINADTELWNTLTVLSQDVRTSGELKNL